MSLGQLLVAVDDLAFASDYAEIPALPPLSPEARVAVLITELDGVSEIVTGDSDTLGVKVPVVEAGDATFGGGVWRVATAPGYLYSTTATAVSIRIYDWVV